MIPPWSQIQANNQQNIWGRIKSMKVCLLITMDVNVKLFPNLLMLRWNMESISAAMSQMICQAVNPCNPLCWKNRAINHSAISLTCMRNVTWLIFRTKRTIKVFWLTICLICKLTIESWDEQMMTKEFEFKNQQIEELRKPQIPSNLSFWYRNFNGMVRSNFWPNFNTPDD